MLAFVILLVTCIILVSILN